LRRIVISVISRGLGFEGLADCTARAHFRAGPRPERRAATAAGAGRSSSLRR
jgi:hypothetical protein